jgi:hypothetical protein
MLVLLFINTSVFLTLLTLYSIVFLWGIWTWESFVWIFYGISSRLPLHIILSHVSSHHYKLHSAFLPFVLKLNGWLWNPFLLGYTLPSAVLPDAPPWLYHTKGHSILLLYSVFGKCLLLHSAGSCSFLELRLSSSKSGGAVLSRLLVLPQHQHICCS